MRYAALLRAVNLGGDTKLSMPALRELLAGLGYADVVTHLQSGNAVFSSDQQPADLEQDIAVAIAERLRVSCAVMVRNGAELAAAVAGHPLGAEPENPSRYFVAFLSAVPEPDKVQALTATSYDPDKVWVRGREAYLWCPNGAAHTKLTNAMVERRLGVLATSRNWNTVTKLASLAGD